jgi:hypothetical protein
MGEGGSIPFMAMLGEKFRQAQFVVTGMLGPHSNAHGPNEFLHIPTARRVSLVIAQVLADHTARTAAAYRLFQPVSGAGVPSHGRWVVGAPM